MTAQLRLVSVNPNPVRSPRRNGVTLHRLAERLTEHVQAGRAGYAHAVAEVEHLNPMDTAVVSTWMARAGLDENQILAVMVGR
jgi:hypothetical protein